VCNRAQSSRFSIQVGAAIANVGHKGRQVYDYCSGDGCPHISALLLVPLMDDLIGSLYSIDQELLEICLLQLTALGQLREHLIDHRLNGLATRLLSIPMSAHAICDDKHTKRLRL